MTAENRWNISFSTDLDEGHTGGFWMGHPQNTPIRVDVIQEGEQFRAIAFHDDLGVRDSEEEALDAIAGYLESYTWWKE